MDVRGKKIYVGLSGGVDSSVSAALLKEAGAEVTGVFIKGWYPPGVPCTWAEDRRDAMRVAARLNLQFHTLDAAIAYKKGVIDYLLAEYRAGRTPNPDVMCNKEIKFGVFYKYAMTTGADYIATGHYRSGEKDQSYFLWAVPQTVMEKSIFPVGHMEKKHVRVLAQRFNLPVAQKKDSQGVCFLGNISVDEFLRREYGEIPGNALDGEGRVIGTHDGVFLYTLGERIALKDSTYPGPWFVQAKDIEKNQLIVASLRIVPTETQQQIPFSACNWLKESSGEIQAQYRYRGQRIMGHIEQGHFVSTTHLSELPTPGQSIVFYKDAELIGGGIISE
jgi:tRNA-specific 2-thiouridylase